MRLKAGVSLFERQAGARLWGAHLSCRLPNRMGTGQVCPELPENWVLPGFLLLPCSLWKWEETVKDTLSVGRSTAGASSGFYSLP